MINQTNSKIVLATRNTNSKEILTTTCLGENINNIHNHLKEFLEENFGITHYAKHIIRGNSGELIETSLVKFIDDESYYSVYGTGSISDNTTQESSDVIEDLDFDGLKTLINSLVMKGFLSHDSESLESRELILNTRPMVLLANITKNKDGQATIQDIATNDSLMINIRDISNEEVMDNNINEYRKIMSIVDSMISNGSFQKDPTLEPISVEHCGEFQVVTLNRNTQESNRLFIGDITDVDAFDNSLVLSSDFLATFKKTEKYEATLSNNTGFSDSDFCEKSLTDHVKDMHSYTREVKDAINNFLF